MGNTKCRVLYGESDANVLAAQSDWMKKAGYSVETQVGRKAIEQALRSGKYDLVVLGHTLNKDDRHHLPYMIRKSNEDARILVLHASGHHPYVDAVLDSRQGKEEILKSITHLMELVPAGAR